MDQDTVDKLARLVGSGQSRRRILKTLTGGALGAITGAIGLDQTEAAKLRSVGNSCTSNSDCGSGLCVQESRTRKICHCAAPSDCPQATDVCHTAACIDGACGFAVNVGTSCNDNNACTTGETCQPNGTCGGGTATVCPEPDQCHTQGTCNPKTGVCSNPAKANGTVCDDGDASICNNVCVDGTCSGVPCTVTCDDSVCPAFSAPTGHCYWLSNGFAGQIPGCWYQTETFDVTYTQQQCEAKNGCASGGCFKWSVSSC